MINESNGEMNECKRMTDYNKEYVYGSNGMINKGLCCINERTALTNEDKGITNDGKYDTNVCNGIINEY